MKRRMFHLLIATLQIMSWLFAVHDGAHHQDGIHESSQSAFNTKQKNESTNGETIYGNEATSRGLSRLGSSPPNCDHKCKGCNPCEATQMPATTDPIRVQYANYEPEGWKCKCGTAFFNP